MNSRFVTTAMGSPLSLVCLVDSGTFHSLGRAAVVAKTTVPLLATEASVIRPVPNVNCSGGPIIRRLSGESVAIHRLTVSPEA